MLSNAPASLAYAMGFEFLRMSKLYPWDNWLASNLPALPHYTLGGVAIVGLNIDRCIIRRNLQGSCATRGPTFQPVGAALDFHSTPHSYSKRCSKFYFKHSFFVIFVILYLGCFSLAILSFIPSFFALLFIDKKGWYSELCINPMRGYQALRLVIVNMYKSHVWLYTKL